MRNSQMRAAVRAGVMLAAGWVALAIPVASGGEPPDAKPAAPGVGELAKIGEQLVGSCVVVEYTLKYDNGDGPGWIYGAAGADASMNYEQVIRDERPAEKAGYVLSPTMVITSDLLLDPRFVQETMVRCGSQVVKATPKAFGIKQNAVYLELSEPLKEAKPLAFDAGATGPFVNAAYRLSDGEWKVSVGQARPNVSVGVHGKNATSEMGESVILDRAGHAVGLSFGGEMAAGDEWKGSPEAWAKVSADELSTQQRAIQKAGEASLPRVALRFRSPKSSDGGGGGGRFGRFMPRGMQDEEGMDQSMTEWNGSGILIDPTTVLILAELKPKVTGRLDGITVFGADGQKASGKFAGTLKDYAGLIAKLDKPLSGPVKLSSAGVKAAKGHLLVNMGVSVLGESRTVHLSRGRISGYSLGWRRQLYPIVGAGGDDGDSSPFGGDQGSKSIHFLFTTDGTLVAAPLARRQKVAMQDRWSGYSGRYSQAMTPAEYISEVMGTGEGGFDSQNRPLSEEEENRLAWLGVEMQAMDPDLARANNAVEQTNGGQSGGAVTYIYPGSPAEQAGVQLGDIILRLHVQGQPKPLEVQLDGENEFAGFDRMWAMMDQIPDEAFESMPQPWGNAENQVNRALTDIGFGTAFTAELFRDGKQITAKFTVTQGPAHYDAAKRFKSESAGLTVRDLTYEVRRYFQLKGDDPGVIISKVEKGGKASVGGLKPYEIVIAVNDQPVTSAAEFEKAIAGGGEFRLNVKRMTVGRIVKITIPAAKAGGEKPAGG